MKSVLVIFLLSFLFFGCGKKREPLAVVPNVDLDRYAGKWYEIARLPTRFEKGCRCVTAEYTLKSDYIEVKNSCTEGEGTKINNRSIKGKAYSTDESGKLKVQFFWPFKADYWIIALDQNYQYAMVGHPNRKYLWLLSRNPELDNSIKQQLLKTARENGFSVEQLEWTVQEDC